MTITRQSDLINPTIHSIGVTNVKVLDRNLNRNFLMIQNNGAANIFVKCQTGAATSADYTLILYPTVGYEFDTVSLNEVNIIAASGTNEVVVTEGHEHNKATV